jgi:hypothetical protein
VRAGALRNRFDDHADPKQEKLDGIEEKLFCGEALRGVAFIS